MSMALPHIHHPIRYCYGPDEPAFQAMLHAWYQVADQLKTQPPGTVAKTQGDWLVMGDVGGELLMLSSPDLRPGSTSTNRDLMAPQYFNGIGAEEFDEIRAQLEEWLKGPVYAGTVDPQVVAENIAYNFGPNADAVADWQWDRVQHPDYHRATIDELPFAGVSASLAGNGSHHAQFSALLPKLEAAATVLLLREPGSFLHVGDSLSLALVPHEGHLHLTAFKGSAEQGYISFSVNDLDHAEAHHLQEFTDPMDFRQASPKVNTPYSPVEYLNFMDELFGASEDQRPVVWSGREAAAQQRAAQTLFRTPGAR